MSEFRYWAFLSYSHQDNLETRSGGERHCLRWAEWLHNSLEVYRVPVEFRTRMIATGEPMPERFFPVFQDEKELPLNADLGESIRRALEQSRFLIIICSPRSATSRYVNEEVRHFKALGRQDRIMTLMIDGEPNASLGNKIGYESAKECFCPALRHPLDPSGKIDSTRRDVQEPIAGDVRVKDSGQVREATTRDMRTHQHVLEYMRLKLIAGLMRVGFDELAQRDKARVLEEARQRARRARRITTGFALLALVAIAAAGFAWWLRGEAKKNATLALEREREAKHTLSMSDFYRANELVESGRPDHALAYLARAIRGEPSNHSAERRIFFLLQDQPWFVPTLDEFPPDVSVHDVRVLSGGRVVVLGETSAGVGTFDEAGRQIGIPKSKEGNPNSGYSDFSFGFVDDGRCYFTEVKGKPPKYWSSISGNSMTPPDSVRRTESATKSALDEITRLIGRQPSESTKLHLSPSSEKVVAWDSSNWDAVYLFQLKPEAKELARLAITSANDIDFVPETEDFVAVSGAHGEYGKFGQIDFPNHERKKLPEECDGVRVAPNGRFLVTRSADDTAQLWSLDGEGLGDLTRSRRKGTIAFGPKAIDFAPDGRRVYVGGNRWNAFGHELVSRKPGEDPIDNEVSNAIRRTDTQDRVQLVTPEPKYDLAKHQFQSPRWIKPLTVHDQRANHSIILENSAGMDSAKLSSDDKKVVAVREKNGEGFVWDAATGGQTDRFSAEPKSEVVLLTGTHFVTRTLASAQLWTLTPLAKSGLPFPATGSVWPTDVHPDGVRVLLCKGKDWVCIWDSAKGQPLGIPIPISQDEFNATFSPDGSYFVVSEISGGSGSGSFRIFDTATVRPLSRAYSSEEIFGDTGQEQSLVGKPFFASNGRLFLSAQASERDREVAYITFNIPSAETDVARWVADLAEAIGGFSISDANALLTLSDEERISRLTQLRNRATTGDLRDRWIELARWLLDDGAARVISPGSALTVSDFVALRLRSTTRWEVDGAARAAPEDPRVFARAADLITTELAKQESDGENPSWRASDEVRAEAFARRARRLDPDTEIPNVATKSNTTQTPVRERAPAATSAEAEFERGETLRKAGGVDGNLFEALACYRRAAEMGHVLAMHRIGVMFATGSGVTKDEAVAVEWYRKAALRGLAEAQYDLGVRYILGRGVPKDEKAGLDWYRKAAAQGWQEAIDALRQHNAQVK